MASERDGWRNTRDIRDAARETEEPAEARELRAEDDARTTARQDALAEGERQAAESLRESRSELRGTGAELRESRRELERAEEMTRQVAENARRLREELDGLRETTDRSDGENR